MTHPGALFLCQMLTPLADIQSVHICQRQNTDQAGPKNRERSVRSEQNKCDNKRRAYIYAACNEA